MANLIRLKQIESGSALNTAASVGQDFTASVISIVSSSLVGVLPDGLVSSSAQINLSEASGNISASHIVGNIIASAVDYQNITNKPSLVSGSQQVVSILNPLNSFSASINAFSSSLDDGFATDAELALTSSLILDQGEW
jgi:hypothetical protein